MPRQYTPRVACVCDRCGATFTVKSSKAATARFCSLFCKNGLRVPRICERCGATFSVKPHKVADGKAKFCSLVCAHLGGGSHRDTANGHRTPEYRAWVAMKTRCFNPRIRAWNDYGGRGITVCDQWRHSFETFLADVGRRPSPSHSIDRIDTNAHYDPSNVRWATHGEQQANLRSNRLITFRGETRILTEWARLLGIRKESLWNRLDTGWSLERALTTRVGRR